MKLKSHLQKVLLNITSDLNLPVEDIQIAPPKNPKFGDLSTSIALVIAKTANKNPMQVAETIKGRLGSSLEHVQEITVSPPGFINFRLNTSYYYSLLADILKESDNFGCGTAGSGKTANVEFVSANPTGPLTVGHGRQAVLGDMVANILEWHGYDVTREYYYNDAGRQMRLLSQSVEARYFQQLGQNATLPEDGYQGQYIVEIAKEIVKQHGQDLPSNDPVFRTAGEDYIFNEIKTSLEKLGIIHDVFTNEKTFYDNGAIDQIIENLKNKDRIYKSDGATWFKTDAAGKDQDRVLIKSTGEPTYRLPDMAYHRNKLERAYDLIVDIFGADHVDTYPDVLSALQALGYDTGCVRVLIHQFVTLIRGGEKVKMSTRKANFVTLSELIDEVGADVVRYFFIMRNMNSHLNFDLDLATDQSENNPVFYLQYAHARISNIIKHGESLGLSFNEHYEPALLTHLSESTLLKKLDLFPEIMNGALESLEPQIIANYLYSLATQFHKFYTECRVITEDQPLSQARLALVQATMIVLANGLRILGISAPERM